MTKIMAFVATSVAVGLFTLAEESLAEPILLEIITDGRGNIREVRDGEGRELERIQYYEERIGRLRLDLHEFKSLPFGAVLGKVGGKAAWCCRLGGAWLPSPSPCYEAEVSGTTTIGVEGEVVRTVLSFKGEVIADTAEQQHVSADIEHLSLKSHGITVVERDSKRYGMVFAADGTLYSPKEFALGEE